MNIPCVDEGTPLHMAAAEGYTDIVQFLLDHGAKVNALSDDGLTALMLAETLNVPDVADVLRRAGALPSEQFSSARWLQLHGAEAERYAKALLGRPGPVPPFHDYLVERKHDAVAFSRGSDLYKLRGVAYSTSGVAPYRGVGRFQKIIRWAQIEGNWYEWVVERRVKICLAFILTTISLSPACNV